MTGQVHQGDVNGVPAFWVDSGRPTLTASLIARQGMVDETFATSGWTHLLEHVALHDRGRGRLEVNGSVSLLHTRFDAHGPADQVAALFTSLAQWLSAPEFDDLERERSVLRAEAAVRGAGDTARALVWRYGAQGPGLAGFAEPGLAQATPARLAELGAQVFVRENCALVLDGPPPRELRLGLDPGRLRPPPAASPCGHALPGAYLIPSGVVVSGVVPRTTAATVLAQVLQAQFTAEFREARSIVRASSGCWSIRMVVARSSIVTAGPSPSNPRCGAEVTSQPPRSMPSSHQISTWRGRIAGLTACHVRPALCGA